MTLRADNHTIPGPGECVHLSVTSTTAHVDLRDVWGSDWNRGQMVSFICSQDFYMLNSDQPDTAVDGAATSFDPTPIDPDSGESGEEGEGEPAPQDISDHAPLYKANVTYRVFIPHASQLGRAGRHWLHFVRASAADGVLRVWWSSKIT